MIVGKSSVKSSVVCEHQRFNKRGKSELPLCAHTGRYCTFCVYANKSTFNKAENSNKKN